MNDNEVTEAMAKLAKAYHDDWVFFVEHGLGIWTWSKMREIIRSVQHNKKTICYACHGSSKTFVAAAIALTFFNLYFKPTDKTETKVVTSAPTFPQVKALLWSQVNELHRESRVRLYGSCYDTEIKVPDHEASFMVGFSTNKQDRAEGWHAWNLLFILDEAKGIAEWMWAAAAAQMGGGNSKMLVISTTDGVQPGSAFHNAAKSPKHNWNRISIDCKELPTFTGEKLRRYKWNDNAGISFEREEKTPTELQIQLSDEDWENEWIREWGSDSVLYLTKCRGQIVDELPSQIIPLWKIEKMYENYEDPDFDDTGTYSAGIDVARMGDDSTAGWLRKGMKYIAGPAELNGKEGFEIVEEYERTGLLKSKDIRVKVDDTGVGGGVVGELKRKYYSDIVPVIFNQSPKDKDHYEYAIDEMWYEMAGIIDKLACKRNDELTKQLTGRKSIKQTVRGQRKVEPKDEYKKRMGGKSPDLADSFLLCWYEPLTREGGLVISETTLY